jgi:hypothetical protein
MLTLPVSISISIAVAVPVSIGIVIPVTVTIVSSPADLAARTHAAGCECTGRDAACRPLRLLRLVLLDDLLEMGDVPDSYIPEQGSTRRRWDND